MHRTFDTSIFLLCSLIAGCSDSVVPRPEVVALFIEWLMAWREVGEDKELADPGGYIDALFVAAGRAQAFDALDEMLEEYGDRLIETAKQVLFFRSNGEDVGVDCIDVK